MSTKPPYYPAKPGDPILAETWNNLQSTIREAIEEVSARLAGALSITGIESSGPITAKGLATLEKGLTVSGGDTSVKKLTATSLTVDTGDTSVAKLTATGDTSVKKLTATDDTSVKKLTATSLTVDTGDTSVAKLTATGDTTVAKLTATGDTSVAKLTATGDTSVKKLTATSLTVDTGDTSVAKLTATGDTTVAKLTATGDTTVAKLTATGDTTVAKLTATGDTTVAKLTATGDTTVAKLTATGDTTVAKLTATGDTSVAKLTATGDTSVKKLTATGLTVDTGDTSVAKLTATGDTSVAKLTATGDTTVAKLTATGDTSVAKLTATGDTSVAKLTATGDTSVAKLTATGDTTVAKLTATGDTSVAKLTATGDTSVKKLTATSLTVDTGDTSVKKLTATSLTVDTGDTSVKKLTATSLTVDTGDTSVKKLTATSLTVDTGDTSVKKLTATSLTVDTGDTSVKKLTATSLTVDTGDTSVKKLTATSLTVDTGDTSVKKLTATSLTVDTGDTSVKKLTATSLTVNVSDKEAFKVASTTDPKTNVTTDAATLNVRLTAKEAAIFEKGLTVQNGIIAQGNGPRHSEGDFGLYATEADKPIRLVTRGQSVKIFTDASDNAPSGTSPDLEIKSTGDVTLRGGLTAKGLTVSLKDSITPPLQVFQAKNVTNTISYPSVQVDASLTVTPPSSIMGLVLYGSSRLIGRPEKDGDGPVLEVQKGLTKLEDLTATTLKVGGEVIDPAKISAIAQRLEEGDPLLVLPFDEESKEHDRSRYCRTMANSGVSFGYNPNVGSGASFKKGGSIKCSFALPRWSFTLALHMVFDKGDGGTLFSDWSPLLQFGRGRPTLRVKAVSQYSCKCGIMDTNGAGTTDVDFAELNRGKWYHIAIRKTVGQCELFVDGDPYGKATMFNPWCDGCGLTIGDNGSQWFVGGMAQVRIYDSALSNEAIKRISTIKN